MTIVLDITKFADFQWKNAHVSKNQGFSDVIYIYFGSSLVKVWLCLVSSLLDMCGRFYGGRVFCPAPSPCASVSSSEIAHPE